MIIKTRCTIHHLDYEYEQNLSTMGKLKCPECIKGTITEEEQNQNIDPIFFRKMAKVWLMKYRGGPKVREAIELFAEFIDTTLAIGNQ